MRLFTGTWMQDNDLCSLFVMCTLCTCGAHHQSGFIILQKVQLGETLIKLRVHRARQSSVPEILVPARHQSVRTPEASLALRSRRSGLRTSRFLGGSLIIGKRLPRELRGGGKR